MKGIIFGVFSILTEIYFHLCFKLKEKKIEKSGWKRFKILTTAVRGFYLPFCNGYLSLQRE